MSDDLPLDLDDLAPAPYNPRRKMTEDESAGLRRSLEKHGDVSGITYNRKTGRLVCGHQRVRELRALGAVMRGGVIRTPQGGEFPVRVVDWTEAQEKEANVTANNPHIASGWDESLDGLLRELQGSMGEEEFGAAQLDKLLGELAPAESEVEQDEVPEPPSEPVAKLGDVWALGEHRLVCGDSTSEDCVARCFDGAAPFMMVTDPPYGVEYDPAWRVDASRFAGIKKAGIVGDAEHDWAKAYSLFGGAVAYVWSSPRYIGETIGGLETAGLRRRSVIAWKKPLAVLSRGHYHGQWESCIYCVRGDTRARWVGGKKESTLWEIALVAGVGAASEDKTPHPTQKPLECMARPIRNHGAPGDIVCDPFAGSGTTIIAAEQLERRCYAVEIEPRYVDVAIERWQQLTGGKAARVAT